VKETNVRTHEDRTTPDIKNQSTIIDDEKLQDGSTPRKAVSRGQEAGAPRGREEKKTLTGNWGKKISRASHKANGTLQKYRDRDRRKNLEG